MRVPLTSSILRVSLKFYKLCEPHRLRVPFRSIASTTVSLPLLGFIFCVFWALYTDQEQATRTHCGVKNYLPSVSAAISGFPLSERVWRICIALHAAPRFAVAYMYYGYLHSVIYRQYLSFTIIVTLLNVFENLGLIGLSFFSSSDYYELHEKFFVLFIVCSTLYMIFLCIVLRYHRNIPATDLESKSLKFKSSLLLFYLLCIGMACYTFIRHNAHCEEGMYTVFALFEYFVILSNMSFHMTAYWDFYDRVVPLDYTLLKT